MLELFEDVGAQACDRIPRWRDSMIQQGYDACQSIYPNLQTQHLGNLIVTLLELQAEEGDEKDMDSRGSDDFL